MEYRDLQRFRLYTLLDHELQGQLQLSSGFSFTVVRKFMILAGVSSTPLTCHFGIKFNQPSWEISYAFSIHQIFSASHQVGYSMVIR